MKRGLPVAACLALVLLLYRGQQTIFSPKGGMAPDVLSSSAAQAAPEMAQAAGAEENAPAAYNNEAEAISEDLLEDAGEPETPDPAMDAAAPRMAPEPAPEEEQAQDSDAAGGERAREDGGEDEQKQVTNSGAATDDAPDDGEKLPEVDGNPDFGEATPYDLVMFKIEPLLNELAAQNAPEEGLTPSLHGWDLSGWDYRVSDTPSVVTGHYGYVNEQGEEVALRSLYCAVTKVGGEAVYRLELISCEEWTPADPRRRKDSG